MTHLRETIGIRATPGRVWSELTDFGRMHTWFPGVRSVRLLDDPPRAGSERILTLLWGASHRERFGLWEPGKQFSIVVLDPPFFARSWTARIAIEDVGEGSVGLHWEMRWEPRFGAPGAAFDRLLLRPAMRAALRIGMRRLRNRVEETAAW